MFSQTTSTSSQEELLKNPAVHNAKISCDTHYEQQNNYRFRGKDYETLGDCIWGELPRREREGLIKGPEGDKSILSPTITESIKLSHTEMERKAMLKFHEYLKKKLTEAIQSSFSNKKETFIGIDTIYDLYEQRVGKNIIESVSSFCIDANMEEDALTIQGDAEGRLAQRKHNLSLLNTLDQEGKVSAYGPWQNCIVKIAPLCYQKTPQDDYTTRRACEVTHHLQAAKRGLIAVKNIKQVLASLKTKNILAIDANIYTGGRGQINVNQATTLTSKEIAESDYATEVKKIEEVARRCRERINEECKQFLIEENDKQQQNADAYSSFSLQTKVRSERIKHFIDEARPQDVEDFIQKELNNLGVNEENKAAFLASLETNDPKEVLKELTKRRYDAERKALNKNIQERLKNTISQNHIGKQMIYSAQEYKQLLHFSNIVSSFLEIHSEEEVMKNTTSLALEIKNNAFEEENTIELDNAWGHIDHKTSKELRELGQEAEINEDLPVLSAEQVNLLLGGKEDTSNTNSNP